MDEMGMGSFGLQGYNKKITKNAIDDRYTAGGSSAGSATAVRAY
jgi:Asp-tRNA(Asn)/Glu-tRNA(Gln) amidotransferase A subunit family amidase